MGQEVVSRIKHRQLNKKKLTIKVFEKKPQKLPNNSEILLQINNYYILRETRVSK